MMFPGSDFYGIKEILLEYAGLPKFLPLPVAVQHGWQFTAHAFEVSANPPEIWVWSDRIAKELEVYCPKERIRVIGSFFCYLLKNLPPDYMNGEKKGSICTPPHSSHLITAEYSVEKFSESLLNIPDDYKPISVMLYYLDMDDSIVKAYEDRGFRVVTNGSLFDHNFLLNFLGNIKGKKYCIFGELGSSVFFSAYCGLDIHAIDTPVTAINKGNPHVTNEMHRNFYQYSREVLNEWNEDYLLSELGCNHIYSRKELRNLILSNYFSFRFIYVLLRKLVGKMCGTFIFAKAISFLKRNR